MTRNVWSRHSLLLGAAALSMLLLLLSQQMSPSNALAAPAATTWYVNAGTGSDGFDCQSPTTACATIGAAVALSQDGDTIEIASGTYTEHDIEVDRDLTLNGAGRETTIIDAGGAGRVFLVTSTSVISGVRVQNGQTVAGNLFTQGGGAILNSTSAWLSLRHVTVISSTAAGSGGGILNAGLLEVEDTEILSNTALGGGGGIYNLNQGVVTVTRSTIGNNAAGSAGAGGGAIYAGGQRLTVIDSNLTGNTANGFGGALEIGIGEGMVLVDRSTLSGNEALSAAALYASSGSITMTNTTLSDNTAVNNYGGIFISGPGTSLFSQNNTIANNGRTNTAGTGYNGVMTGNSAVATLVNTLVAGNQERNCGSLTPSSSLGHNLSDDYTCQFTQSGDIQGVDPSLGPLSATGGGVLTHGLTPGSVAIDAGADARCPASDARGIARPFDGDGDGTAICDIGAFEARNQISVFDTTVIEGDAAGAAVTAGFTVTLAPTSTSTVEVAYATVDGTALGGADYIADAGVLTFNPGESEKLIVVDLLGDDDDEPDEAFEVQLSAPVNADLLDASAVATIVDNDGLPTLTIADQSTLEGNAGLTTMEFAVTLSPAGSDVVTVDYATVSGTAGAGSDFTATAGTLTFQPGQTSKTIEVDVLGDVVDEGPAETFTLSLSDPISATVAGDPATGTITDDDSARLRHELGPEVLEGDSGLTPAVFTVTLSTPAAFEITVDYEVSSGFGDDGAKVGEDFEPVSGTLTFPAGTTVRNYTVEVIGDTVAELDERFNTLISNATAPINVNGSSGVVLNDDDLRIYLPLVQR